jgi:hypothetical protein
MEFRRRWGGVSNFLLGGGCAPFAYRLPPLERIVEELRADPEARITSGRKSDRLDLADVAAEFRGLPVAEAMRRPFALAHFQLARFDAPGRCLHGFTAAVLNRWQEALRAAGFTWERCYPIVFISGIGCATNYHMDFSQVLAWQVYGTKRFCGLREPERWAPREVRVNYRPEGFVRPAALTMADAECFDMRPGDLLWNTLLTPHWVEAGGEVAMSINLSHGGLRLHGELCAHEAELIAHRGTNPVAALGRG